MYHHPHGMYYVPYEERMRRLRAIAKLEDERAARKAARVKVYQKPHPRRKHPHQTPKTWQPEFPYPMITSWDLINRYALYFGGQSTR